MSEGNVERFLQQYFEQARNIYADVTSKVYAHMFRRTQATDFFIPEWSGTGTYT